MRSYWLDLSDPAHRILYKLGLSARGKTELEILKKLSQGSANVYERKWKKLRNLDVHYSTVLRALRRLGKKKLVRVKSSKQGERRTKTYACTVLGELVAALARNGIDGAAQIVAESSSSFRECVGERVFEPWLITESVIWNILESEKPESFTLSDFDVYVKKVMLEQIEANLVRALFYDPSRPNFDDRYYLPLSRPEILRHLNKFTHIGWIADWLVQIIEKYVEKENEWLQALEDFKREVRLAKSFDDETYKDNR